MDAEKIAMSEFSSDQDSSQRRTDNRHNDERLSSDDIIAESPPTAGLLAVPGATTTSTRDLESQRNNVVVAPPEHYVSLRSKLIFLAAYFFLNLFLTLSNKAVLGKARFPWLLTGMHATATSIGCFGMLSMGFLKLSYLSTKDHLVLIAFSLLFTVNIAISNVSLAMVSVPFHQILRSACPVVAILIYRWAFGRTYSTATYLTMVPLILGCAIATAGDYQATVPGFLMTLLGVFLASVKTVATNRIMTGPLSLSALELLLRMSPLASIQCIFYAFMTGEADRFRTTYAEGQLSGAFGAALLVNAATAFLLNVVGFQANKMAGALTITVCSNVKQALTILFGIVLFHVQVGIVNAIGMLITIGGAVWYSKVELDNKLAKKPR